MDVEILNGSVTVTIAVPLFAFLFPNTLWALRLAYVTKPGPRVIKKELLAVYLGASFNN